MSTHNIGPADQVPEGGRLVVELQGKQIAVFNIDDEYYAYVNWCAHQAGPACEGNITGTMEAEYDNAEGKLELDYCKEGEILNCPWHGWEYDLTTGESLSRQGVVLPQYDVEEQGGNLIVSLS